MGATITVDEIRALFKDSVSSVVRDEMSKVGQGSGASDVVAALRTFGIGRKPQDVDKGQLLGRVVRTLINGRFDPYSAIQHAKAKWADKEKDLFEAVEKVMGAGNATAGGFWLPSDITETIVEFLRSRSVVRRSGAQVWPLDSGSLALLKQTAGTSATYTGEGEAAAASAIGTGQVKLIAKKITAKCGLTLEMLMYGGDQIDNYVRNDLIAALALGEDRAFLRGLGTENSPKGLRYLAAPGNITATNGTDLDSIRQDLQELQDALETNDVPMENPWIFMNPRSKNWMKLRVSDGNGNLVFAQEINAGKLSEANLAVTTSMVKNLGAGADESEIILADMKYAAIGQVGGIMLSSSDQATFTDENDVTRSCFDESLTVVKAVMMNDFGFTMDVAAAVKTGVKYGA